ncbi:MAG TPA: hypothetical protein VMA09_08330 [Candidatus Binataceae bacterium]|nr:hypothetical protein [Candidatus Binataceae bacterium]
MQIRETQVLYALLFTVLTVLGVAAVGARYFPGLRVRAFDVIESLASAAVFVVFYYYGDIAYDKVAAELGEHVAQIAIAVVAVATGAFMHWFKRRNLMLYALIEVAFGVASAFSISQSMNTSSILLTQVAALVGCAFIVSRGLDNLALTQRPAQ